MTPSHALPGETVPELELKEYRIIGKDTRVFVITGDKRPTVNFTSFPLPLAEEERSRETSEGLITETERFRREEDFSMIRGISSSLDYTFGTRATNDLTVKASLDGSKTGFSLYTVNRAAKEHTPDNRAPLSQEAGVTGYFKVGETTGLSLDFGVFREDDDALGKAFRPGEREANLYHAGFSLNTHALGPWPVRGNAMVRGGTYSGFGGVDEEDETVLTAGVRTAGMISGIEVTVDAAGTSAALGDVNGSLFSAGAAGNRLFLDALGVTFGADVFVFSRPDEDTKVRLYPKAIVDMSITPRVYARLFYHPGVRVRPFSGMYEENGLVTTLVPVLFEERSMDAEGEIGVHILPQWSVSAGGFASTADNSLVFSMASDYFDVVPNTEVNLSGFRLKTEFAGSGRLGADGRLDIINSSWNFSEKGSYTPDEVPYVPKVDARLDAFFVPFRFWKLRASARYYGKHYVRKDSADSESSFFILDTGVERNIWKEYLSMFIELRNLTNSKGSWWTDAYTIPGIGLYTGIKAHY